MEGHWLTHPEARDPTDVVHFGQPPSAEDRVNKGPANCLTLLLQQVPQNIFFSPEGNSLQAVPAKIPLLKQAGNIKAFLLTSN